MDWKDFIEQTATRLNLFGDARQTFLQTFPSRDEKLSQDKLADHLHISIDTLKKRYQKDIFPPFLEIEGLTLPTGKGKLKKIQEWLCQEFQKCQPSDQVSTGDLRGQPQNLASLITLSDLLSGFDYTPQSTEYEKLRISSSPVIAFLVRAECQYVQKWLVKRLSRQLNSYGLPDKFHLFLIDAGIADIRHCGIDSLWSMFEVGGIIPTSQSEVVNLLTELYAQNKTIVIALYRLSSIQDPTTVKNILRFWQEIASQLKTKYIPERGEYSKLVLLLSDNSLGGCPLRAKYQLDQSLLQLIPNTDALERFPEEEVRDFLLKPDFCQPIQEKYGIDKYREICNDIYRWQQKPQDILDAFCSYSNIGGFAEYKEAWDLTYEA